MHKITKKLSFYNYTHYLIIHFLLNANVYIVDRGKKHWFWCRVDSRLWGKWFSEETKSAARN